MLMNSLGVCLFVWVGFFLSGNLFDTCNISQQLEKLTSFSHSMTSEYLAEGLATLKGKKEAKRLHDPRVYLSRSICSFMLVAHNGDFDGLVFYLYKQRKPSQFQLFSTVSTRKQK